MAATATRSPTKEEEPPSQALAELRAERARQDEEILRLQRQCRESEAWGRQLGTTYLRDFKAKLEQEEARRIASESELNLLRDQCAALQLSKRDLHSRVAEDNREIVLLKHSLADAENQIEKYRIKYQAELSSKQLLERNLDETKNSMCELSMTKHEMQRLLKLKQDRIDELQGLLLSAEKNVARAEEGQKEAERSRAQAMQDLTSEKQLCLGFRDAADDATAKLRLAEKANENLRVEMERLQSQLGSCKADLAEASSRITNYKTEADTLKFNSAQEKNEKGKYMSEMATLKAEMERMQKEHDAQLAAMQEENQTLARRMENAIAELEDYRIRTEDARFALEQDQMTLQDELQGLKQDYDDIAHQLKNVNMELEAERVKHSQAVLEMSMEKRDKEEATEELATATQQLDLERKAKDELRDKLFERIGELEAQINISQDALNESVEVGIEKTRLANEKKQLEGRVNDLEGTVADLQEEKLATESKMKRLQMDLDSEKAEVIRLTQANRTLESELYRAQLGETTTVTRIVELEEQVAALMAEKEAS